MNNKIAAPVAAHDLAVFIGRFQPFHSSHLKVVEAALDQAKHLLIIIGSAGEARRADYLPFTAPEREKMILDSLSEDQKARVFIRYCEDFNNMTLWTEEVQKIASDISSILKDRYKVGEISVTLIGHSKDKSSYYLKAFPDWDSIEVKNHKVLSATQIRENYFSATPKHVDWFLANDFRGAEWSAKNVVPNGTYEFLKTFRTNPEYKNMVEEWDFMRKYLAQWDSVPYKPIFVTVDNVVIQAGHVLLIQRKSRPGMGLWALPGGHLDQEEYIEHACIRELREETKLKVPENVLRGSLITIKVFDSPHRSMRGRTITHAALFHLQPKAPDRLKDEDDTSYKKKVKEALALPKVRAADDAKRAKWVRLDEIKRDQMFEDHFAIIQAMKQLIKD